MDGKIVSFNSKRDDSTRNIPSVLIGTIYLDLLVSIKDNALLFKPSYELEDGLDDELIDTFAKMLKQLFPNAIDLLFEGYKSGK